MKDTPFLLLGPIRQLLTLSNLPDRGGIADDALMPLTNGGILMRGEHIYRVGPFCELVAEATALQATFVELSDDFIGMPGLVDAHTHICFAGSRAGDYALRNAGKTYLEIAQTGGGIWDTVTQTRHTTLSDLTRLTVQRANRHVRDGVTTIEVKSGYGLSIAEELKMLRAIEQANGQTVTDLISTCLAAHMLPKDYHGTAERYLQELTEELLPTLQTEQLTQRVDAFIEQGAFSAEQIAPYFAAAQRMGFSITVHADQFHPGGSAVAVAFEALSVDHLEASGDHEIQLLAQSRVIPVALPGASLGLGCGFAPARRLLDAGTSLAIASDWNPGSAPMGDLLAQAAILGASEKLTTAEVLSGITFRAALALNCTDRGKIQAGMLADLILFPGNDYREILYQQGRLKPQHVWKRGTLVG
ncbi:MAG: imidazolonepropionase [Rudanella sp.]|nr:imidazolonepropionase [Rudanella sp.]